ncbi:MAG TPA: hypothetical protein VM489_08180 [Burkholderiales bacterium]|nr:hypothetical protein [Burkholderiales bacterium]
MQGAEDFHGRIDGALRLATAVHPQMVRLAEFVLGPGQHVEVIRAPDGTVAREALAAVNALEGIRAELASMRSRW